MDLDLRGQTVLITGGSQGIGLATAHAFAAEGCHLHLAARTESRLREAQRDITEKFGGRVDIHPIDVAIGENAKPLARDCSDVDILVNNAGAVPGGSLEEVDEASWCTAWNLKVLGYINLTREIYRAMAERGRGVIVNVIGTAGNIVPASYIVGVSGSASLVAFTQALGGMSLDRGVRVVGVSPGDVLNERGIRFLRQQAAETWVIPNAGASGSHISLASGRRPRRISPMPSSFSPRIAPATSAARCWRSMEASAGVSVCCECQRCRRIQWMQVLRDPS